MQKKRISFASLVGRQTGAATLENSMEVPQNINCTTRYLSKGYRIQGMLFQRGICTPMFIVVLSAIAKVWKEPKCPSMDELIKKIYDGVLLSNQKE